MAARLAVVSNSFRTNVVDRRTDNGGLWIQFGSASADDQFTGRKKYR